MDAFQLPDRLIYIFAGCTALAGLVLLFLVAPAEDAERYVLRGEVVGREGRAAIVRTNVTVVGKNLSGSVEREVFWDGDEFIALAQGQG